MDVEKCSTQSSTVGDDLDDSLADKNLVVFVHVKGDNLECYDYYELDDWWK
jgi:hypothetical protein